MRQRENSQRLFSIRGKLTIFVVSLIAVATAGITVTGYAVVRQILKDDVQEHLGTHARGRRDVLTRYVEQQHERIRLIASRTQLRERMAALGRGEVQADEIEPRLTQILRDALDAATDFLSIHLLDTNGRLIASTAPPNERPSSSPVAAPLEDVVLDLPRERDGELLADLLAPARTGDGVPVGTVWVVLRMQPLVALMEVPHRRFRGTTVRIATRGPSGDIRYVLHHPDDRKDDVSDEAMALALDGREGYIETDGPNGDPIVAAYAPVGYGGWGLVAQVDRSEAYAPIARFESQALVTGGVVFLLGVIAARLFARRFTSPLLELSHAALRLRRGQAGARAEVTTNDEIGALCATFNEMAATIEANRETLERKVLDRTQKLRESRNELRAAHEKAEDRVVQLEQLCRVLEEQAETIEQDLKRAEVIQRALLPSAPPELPGFQVHTLYRPGHNVGGDFYDVQRLDDRHVAFVIADATGHGVSAAMLAVLFKHRLRMVDETTGDPLSPSAALHQVNCSLRSDVSAPGMFLTAIYGVLDLETRTLEIASGGHPPLLWAHEAGHIEEISQHGPALGLYPDATFEPCTLTLAPRDRILFYTDGLLETEGTEIQTLGPFLEERNGSSSDLLRRCFQRACGNGHTDRDDVTMILLEASEGESRFDDREREDQASPRRSPIQAGGMLSFGETDEAWFLCLEGRGTWMLSQVFYEAATSVRELDRPLVIDLTHCTYLDSTFLGTIHEVISRAQPGRVHLQAVQDAVHGLFRELCMTQVLERVRETTLALPKELVPLLRQQPDLQRDQWRILRAHEVLAALSEANRDQFADLVQALRAELKPGCEAPRPE
ncbi:MAG: SpoIIE family protein phosphatase [Planctomycetes bacterium]|nr:SpoIIE family protein phosphatase [Planctomycetota bacterium]